jgi:hypothetical protein
MPTAIDSTGNPRIFVVGVVTLVDALVVVTVLSNGSVIV